MSERITIGGLFDGSNFQKYLNSNTWLIMDIEGGEDALLRPDLYPALKQMTILVEAHDCFIPEISKTIALRFQDTHHIQNFSNQVTASNIPTWMDKLGHLDQLIALWEWRMGPTPWLVMTPKSI